MSVLFPLRVLRVSLGNRSKPGTYAVSAGNAQRFRKPPKTQMGTAAARGYQDHSLPSVTSRRSLRREGPVSTLLRQLICHRHHRRISFLQSWVPSLTKAPREPWPEF